MLDSETKRRIDTARDVLVGKIPDPKSQVEQITIGLIYKFMDDMDIEAEELGGKRKFFAGGFAMYSWTELMRSGLSGFETLNRYAEGISKMTENPGIPPLFRAIFKNAFLPFRDPETLKMFLKVIDEFNYEHSEKLGDAFEYLLSVLGSQGDAGQFRTPRHIIDFIIETVDPKKEDKILDPACGTAGFLISSYKHILKANIDQKGNTTITPEDKSRLAKNLTGYDISPDMVRLSLVNMYLHGFSTPQIHEYDTLTSLDKWNEYADVILANPPFMSPKGGIKPHNRFQISCNRSEVLFVDYIMEHLTPNGRAGVIVPEGIIFQSANAYKALRKSLIDTSLIAVISLPSGVFNPYSGVKTSILILDKQLSKKTDKILFVKIENDGFDLGAQRRQIDKNDIPEAIKTLKDYKQSLKTGNPFTPEGKAMTVEKSKLAENDNNLSADRYKEVIRTGKQQWPMVRLGDVCEVRDGTHDSPKYVLKGYPLITSKNLKNGQLDFTDVGYISKDDFNKVSQRSYVDLDDIIMPMIGTIGGACLIKNKIIEFAIKNVALFKKSKCLIPEYLLYILNSESIVLLFERQSIGVTQKFVSLGFLRDLQIPLPPLDIQKEVVKEIDSYQSIIDGAKKVISSWKPKIDIDPSWPLTPLGSVCEINPESAEPNKLFGKDTFVYIDISSVDSSGSIDFSNEMPSDQAPSRARRVIKNNDVLISTVRPNLKAFAHLSKLPKNVIASTGFAILSSKCNIDSKYLYYICLDDNVINQMIEKMGKGAYPSINVSDVQSIQISLPPLETQNEIVERIEKERKIIEPLKELIPIYENKIKDVLSSLW